jgi:hypothetical protein
MQSCHAERAAVPAGARAALEALSHPDRLLTSMATNTEGVVAYVMVIAASICVSWSRDRLSLSAGSLCLVIEMNQLTEWGKIVKASRASALVHADYG